MFTSKDLSPMLGLMYLTRSHTPEDELSCCNAYKEIAFFSICAPMSLIHTMFYHIVCKQIAPYITCFTVLFVMLHSLKWFLPSMSSEVGL